MRILYFVQYFNLPDEPGGSRAYQFARAWARAGHEVTVVTGAVNHKTLSVPEKYRGRLAVQERIDGFSVLRVWSYAGIRGSFRRRLVNFLSYACTAALVGWIRGGKADLVYASSTPLTVGLPGWFNALVRRVPWVFELRDLWPESAVVAGVLSAKAWSTRAAAWLARRFYSSATLLVAVTQGIADGLVGRGVPPERVILVPNGVDDWMLEAGERDVPEPEEGLRIVYCGAHGHMNSLDQILDAASLLRSDPVRFVFIGDGDERERLMARARDEGLEDVEFLGAMPKREAFDHLRRASATIVTIWNVEFQRMVLANKIFDYLAAGRPVIVGADGEMAELVGQAHCGVVVAPEQPEKLAEGIRRLLAMSPDQRREMGRAGRRYTLARYQRRDLAWRLLQAFEELTGKPAARKPGGGMPRLVEGAGHDG